MTPAWREVLRAFGTIAALSFGGPAGQIAVMHRVLVDERRWLTEARFLHALNFCMLLPGPEAMQLATYAGWLVRGVPGALVAGLLFVAPGMVAMMALSVLYVTIGNVPVVEAALLGLKAAVLAIVVQALLKVARRALTDAPRRAIAVAAFVAIFALGVPFPAVILAAALLGWLAARGTPAALPEPGETPPVGPARRAGVVALVLWLAPVAALVTLAPGSVYAGIATFFSQLAVLTFGGAYAVLAWVAQEAASARGWLTAGQMLDGLGLAETTPGPLIMVLQFVGFLAAHGMHGTLAAAVAGGLLATWVTFAPCFAWIFLLAPEVERLRGRVGLSSALAGVTAAVVGVIANLGLWFGLHVLFREVAPGPPPVPTLAALDPVALALTALAFVLAFVLHRGMAVTLAGTTLAGLALHAAGLA